MCGSRWRREHADSQASKRMPPSIHRLAVAFAVVAPRPAARPPLALLKLLLGAANAAFSGHRLLGVLYPADELVAGQRRDVLPGIERRRVADQSFAQVFRKFVDHPTGHTLTAHKTTVAAIVDAREAPRRVRPRGWRAASTIARLSLASSYSVAADAVRVDGGA